MNGSAGDPAGSSEPKPWERAWSTDEMRQNAHAWNLAGDTGLLKYLQEFSQVTPFTSLSFFSILSFNFFQVCHCHFNICNVVSGGSYTYYRKSSGYSG